jgi:tryptophan synthase alpha chain
MTLERNGAQRIRAAFAEAKARGGALLPFVTGCYPNQVATEDLLRELPSAGADLIEVGFPFSDPIADGPVIAASMHNALLAGATPAATFEAIATARCTVPVVAMVSISIVERMGPAHFLRAGVEAGCSGFIVPDADPTSAHEIARLATELGAGFCPLVAPTTSLQRMSELAALASGFVYLLARAGVTGERSDAPDIEARVQALRKSGNGAPIAAGFGISSREHVRAVLQHADGAIVGSAIVRAMTNALESGSEAFGIDGAATLASASSATTGNAATTTATPMKSEEERTRSALAVQAALHCVRALRNV